jgi:hypothetical protein
MMIKVFFVVNMILVPNLAMANGGKNHEGLTNLGVIIGLAIIAQACLTKKP